MLSRFGLSPSNARFFGAWLAIMVVVSGYRVVSGPVYLGANSDPDYGYLLSSLTILNRDQARYVDHPGTPAQIVGAVAMGVHYGIARAVGSEREDITSAVLKSPEAYLSTVSWVFRIAFAFLLLWIHRRTSGRTQDSFSFFFALCLLSSPTLMDLLHQFTAEQTLVLATLLFAYFMEPAPGLPFKPGWRAALAGATAISSKVVFLPLLVWPTFSGRQRRTLWFWLFLVVFMVCWLLPISSQLDRLQLWLSSLLTHTGRYGSGDAGFVDFKALGSHFISLAGKIPEFYCLLGGAWFFIIAHGRRDRFFVGAVIACTLQFLVVLKHPAPHYLLPSFVILAWLCARHLTQAAQSRRPLPWLVAGTLLVGAVGHYRGVSEKREYVRAEEQLTQYLQNRPECRQGTTYLGSGVPAAFRLGDILANRFSWHLNRLYPEALFYNGEGRVFVQFNDHGYTAEELKKKSPCVLMTGMKLPDPGQHGFKEVFSTPKVSVYEFGL
ncbi:MAG: hypothetical protein AB7F66_03345 [Bacteriovoracia bacterium]